MLAEVTIDGMVEDEFRQAIETLLREGNADHAAKWLKSRLEAVCGDGLPLPARFLAVAPADITVTGWEDIPGRLERLDAIGSPITALGIDLGDPEETGSMTLHVETRFYTDDGWPFSRYDRARLLAGYEGTGARPWAGSLADVDDTIGIEGIDDLYGLVLGLEYRRRDGEVSSTELRAHMLGASYIAVLVHLAVRETALQCGLPRPMAVLVGSNESYPCFDAPVIAAPDALVTAPLPRSGPVEFGQSEPEEDFADTERNHPALAELRELAEPDADPGQEPEGWAPPVIDSHVSGTQLRKRLVTPESIAELEAARKPNLLDRLFRRK